MSEQPLCGPLNWPPSDVELAARHQADFCQLCLRTSDRSGTPQVLVERHDAAMRQRVEAER